MSSSIHEIRNRHEMEDSDWLDANFSNRLEEDRRIALAIVKIIGRALSVKGTKLRLTDRIYDDYGFAGRNWWSRLGVANDSWEIFTKELASLVVARRGREITDSESARIFHWRTLQDVIEDTIRMSAS